LNAEAAKDANGRHLAQGHHLAGRIKIQGHKSHLDPSHPSKGTPWRENKPPRKVGSKNQPEMSWRTNLLHPLPTKTVKLPEMSKEVIPPF